MLCHPFYGDTISKYAHAKEIYPLGSVSIQYRSLFWKRCRIFVCV